MLGGNECHAFEKHIILAHIARHHTDDCRDIEPELDFADEENFRGHITAPHTHDVLTGKADSLPYQ